MVLSRSSAQTQVPTVLTVKHLQPKEFIIRLNKSNPYGHIPKRQLCRTTRFFSDQLAARRCHSFLAFSPITVKTPQLRYPPETVLRGSLGRAFTPGPAGSRRPFPPRRAAPVPARRRQETLPTPPPSVVAGSARGESPPGRRRWCRGGRDRRGRPGEAGPRGRRAGQARAERRLDGSVRTGHGGAR